MRKTKLKSKKVTSALQDALLKKAIGYTCSETIEEYSKSDDELTLTKRKVTKKEIPPDTTALKALLEIYEGEKDSLFDNLSDFELEEEKKKILEQLKGMID